MKRFQRRIDKTETGIQYHGYTKDGFYFKSTSSMWCWKQESKGIIHKEKTIDALKKIKDEEFKGQGNYDHSKTHDYQKFEVKSGYLNTEEFAFNPQPNLKMINENLRLSQHNNFTFLYGRSSPSFIRITCKDAPNYNI